MRKKAQNLFKSILLLTMLFLGLTFTACSEDDNEVTVKKDPTLKLVAAKTEIVPFEDVKVSIDVDFDLLLENYDSITWKANGVAYGFFQNPWYSIDEQRDIRLTDYRVGVHKAYVLGYKDGSVISKDSIEYKVNKPQGDFISISWNKNTKNEYFSYTTGLTPDRYLPTNGVWSTVTGGVCLNLDHFVEDENGEYAILQFVPWRSSRNVEIEVPDFNDFHWGWDYNKDDQEPRYAMEYTFHHTYLTELYGEPTLVYNGDDVTQTTLMDEYKKRFKQSSQSQFYPVEIWETPTSVICLTRANNQHGGVNQKGISLVIAEPRK